MSVREHFSLTFIRAFPLSFGRRTSDSSAGETNDDVFLREMEPTSFFSFHSFFFPLSTLRIQICIGYPCAITLFLYKSIVNEVAVHFIVANSRNK